MSKKTVYIVFADFENHDPFTDEFLDGSTHEYLNVFGNPAAAYGFVEGAALKDYYMFIHKYDGNTLGDHCYCFVDQTKEGLTVRCYTPDEATITKYYIWTKEVEFEF